MNQEKGNSGFYWQICQLHLIDLTVNFTLAPEVQESMLVQLFVNACVNQE